MKNISIWQDIKKDINYNTLDKNIDVDVCIIGGGITGISVAYHLINNNLKVCLIEKNNIGQGVTSRTTGKLTYLQENMYNKIKNYHGINKAKLYLDSQIDAIKIVKNIIKNNNIDCNLEKVNSYVFTTFDNKKINKDIKILNELGVNIKISNTLPDNKKVNKCYYVEDTYVFHPLKYIYNLANICSKNNIDIYENSKIISIDKNKNYYICKTNNHSIKTKYIIFATHYPYFIFPYFLPFKSYIEKSYISAYKTKNNYKYSSISIDKPIISTRYHKDKELYKLLLTNSHNLCIKDNLKYNFKNLLNKEIDYIWSNKDIITIDSLPFIGLIDKNMLIATGYNTWGMTNASIAGKIISDIILNKDNKYINLFNPKRGINTGKIINFPLILGSNMYSFIKSKVYKNKNWYSKNIKFEKRNGKNVGIFIDEKNKEHIVYNLCPHLKCSLIFNEIERTWDCPCHASRFDIDGNIIEGPSNYNIKYLDK